MAKKKSASPVAPKVCPVCGEIVPRGSLSCPDCGADHRSGWREDTDAYDATGLPDDDFNYENFVREEFGSSAKPVAVKTIWWVTAIVLLAAFAAIYLCALR